jgi:hypothetical protein
MYYPFNCNKAVVRVAIDVHSELQILSAIAWYYITPSVATRRWFVLQSMYTPSCKYWVLLPDTVLSLQLQPDIVSSCNRCTLLVANNEYLHMIMYYPFSCNHTVVRVVIDVHSELQILSPSAWYCITPLVATGHHFELQSRYTPSCK